MTTRSIWTPRLKPVVCGLLLTCMTALATPALAASCGTPGKDGNVSTAAPTMVYMTPTASVTAGATSIPVSSTTGLAAGDLVLVIQMQAADINSTNTANYGDGSSGTASGYLNNADLTAGQYEYAAVASVTGTTITLKNGLTYAYTEAAYGTNGARTYQVIRVPQYGNLTLTGTVSVTPWNGTTGGVLPMDVAGTLAFAGNTISADYTGFRGGGAQMLDGATGGSNTAYASNANTTAFTYPGTAVAGYHASKGEGIAGTPRYSYNEIANTETTATVEGYPGGSFARGAPATAGGGGTDEDPAANDQNSGGGGGGNGGAGAQGGNSWSTNVAVGGHGGAAFGQASVGRIVMGGGGGAGTRNNSTAYQSSGGQGGGIVIVRAINMSGTGTISAGGGTGPVPSNDGGGGGGAGGTIVVLASASTATLTLNALGGAGANTCIGCSNSPVGANYHGPGGGGGGGLIYTTSNVASTNSTTQGASGYSVNAGNYYGATSSGGNPGTNVPNASVTAVSGSPFSCLEPTLSVLKSANGTSFNPGSTVTYSITITNTGTTQAYSVVLTDTVPPDNEITFVPNAYGTGTNFQFVDSSTHPSGLTLGTTQYSANNGSSYSTLPGATGWQNTMTNFRVTMSGTMNAGGQFTINYQAVVH